MLSQEIILGKNQYLQLTGYVNKVNSRTFIDKLSLKKVRGADSILYVSINKIVDKNDNAVDVLNQLAIEDWELISVTNISNEPQSAVASLIYYFKRQRK